jgi:hypothetical protein
VRAVELSGGELFGCARGSRLPAFVTVVEQVYVDTTAGPAAGSTDCDHLPARHLLGDILEHFELAIVVERLDCTSYRLAGASWRAAAVYVTLGGLGVGRDAARVRVAARGTARSIPRFVAAARLTGVTRAKPCDSPPAPPACSPPCAASPSSSLPAEAERSPAAPSAPARPESVKPLLAT